MDAIKNALFEQLFRPVRWIKPLQSFAAYGVTQAIECVPGKVLTGLNSRIDAICNVWRSTMARLQAAVFT